MWWKGGSSFTTLSSDLEEEAEQVDYVQVDAERGKNIFLRTDAVAFVS